MYLGIFVQNTHSILIFKLICGLKVNMQFLFLIKNHFLLLIKFSGINAITNNEDVSFLIRYIPTSKISERMISQCSEGGCLHTSSSLKHLLDSLNTNQLLPKSSISDTISPSLLVRSSD